MDGDGSFDPVELLPLLDDVRSGRADLAVGRRRPVARGVWPWHARAGNRLVVAVLRRRRLPRPRHRTHPGLPPRRPPRPGRPGPEVRLPGRAAAEGHAGGLADRRARRVLPPAGGRDPVEGVRLGAGHGPDRPRLLAGARMTARRRQCLVVAKAPVAGRAKTRLGAEIGMAAAADLAAAALLDTLDACRAAFGAGRCHLALTGDLAGAARGRRDRPAALAGWTVFEQVGDELRRRLAWPRARRGRSSYRGPDRPDRDGHPAGHRGRCCARSPPGSTTTTPCSGRPRTAAGGCSRCATRRSRGRRCTTYPCRRRTTGAPTRARLCSDAG